MHPTPSFTHAHALMGAGISNTIQICVTPADSRRRMLTALPEVAGVPVDCGTSRRHTWNKNGGSGDDNPCTSASNSEALAAVVTSLVGRTSNGFLIVTSVAVPANLPPRAAVMGEMARPGKLPVAYITPNGESVNGNVVDVPLLTAAGVRACASGTSLPGVLALPCRLRVPPRPKKRWEEERKAVRGCDHSEFTDCDANSPMSSFRVSIALPVNADRSSRGSKDPKELCGVICDMLMLPKPLADGAYSLVAGL
jgi:hypothetical protein